LAFVPDGNMAHFVYAVKRAAGHPQDWQPQQALTVVDDTMSATTTPGKMATEQGSQRPAVHR
jgi:hypothetical protein